MSDLTDEEYGNDDGSTINGTVTEFREFEGDVLDLLMRKMFDWKDTVFNDQKYTFMVNGIAEAKRRQNHTTPAPLNTVAEVDEVGQGDASSSSTETDDSNDSMFILPSQTSESLTDTTYTASSSE